MVKEKLRYKFQNGEVVVYTDENGVESVAVSFHNPEYVVKEDRWTEFVNGRNRVLIFGGNNASD